MINENIQNYFIETDEGSADPMTRTILLIHGSHADKLMCENDAKSLICKAYDELPRSDRFPVQCLLVNLRGSGASYSDDYHNEHTVVNATEDVLTLVQSVCTGGVRSPGLVVAYGTLGKAIAVSYTHSLLKHGGDTQHVHSEVSGKGAIKPPTIVLLKPGDAKEDALIGPGGEKLKRSYEFEKDVSDELLASAQEYMQDGVEKTLAKLGLGGPEAPVKVVEDTRDIFTNEALYALLTENPHYCVN